MKTVTAERSVVTGHVRAVRDDEAEIERQNKLAVKELDGSFVRIPGYVMPLETSGTAIDEFMLVPTIGACIHTPVPPANQMVFVEVKESFYAQELYEPVWVTGLMKLEYEKNSIPHLVDTTCIIFRSHVSLKSSIWSNTKILFGRTVCLIVDYQ